MDVKQRNKIYESVGSLARKCIFGILSVAALPNHIAFIMDGNRRYSKQHNLIDGGGHRVGFSSLMSMLRYCYELGVKYVTIYAFSIENFKRSPEEVQSLMDLMEEKIEGLIKEESIVNQYGVRVYFIGNLKLLSKPVRFAAERAMDTTAKNSKAVLLICIAYTSTDEISHAVHESCEEKWDEVKVLDDCEIKDNNIIGVADIERHMYMAVAPDPDVIIRTSGETRLSYFGLPKSFILFKQIEADMIYVFEWFCRIPRCSLSSTSISSCISVLDLVQDHLASVFSFTSNVDSVIYQLTLCWHTLGCTRDPLFTTRVILQNKYKENLVAILHETGSKEVVIVCHGYRSCKDRIPMVNLVAAFANEGISAFRLDFAGNGEGSFQYGNYN
nr:dehydrodolichyl diphosphate synthase 6-like [Tanacetum cinerariifolium]